MVRLKFDEPSSRLLAFEMVLGDGNAVKNVLLLLLFLEIDMDLRFFRLDDDDDFVLVRLHFLNYYYYYLYWMIFKFITRVFNIFIYIIINTM